MDLSLRTYFRSLFVIFLFGLFSFSIFAQPKNLTILHTNDMHASFLPHEAIWVNEKTKPLIGGFNELSYAIDSIRRTKIATLTLDAGDVMTGNPITEFSYAGALGGVLFAMMNDIGYDAWTTGNHEFDYTADNLRKLASIANFPLVSANILDTLGRFPVNNREYIIIEKNGLKIGIIGIISREFYELVNKFSSKGIKILPPVETVKKIAEQIKSKTDLLIALTHEGVHDDSILAVNVPQLNVIVGGHSHTQLFEPKIVNGVIIVQTGSRCENLGVLDLSIENNRVIWYKGSLLPLWYNSSRNATPLSKFIDSMKNEIDLEYSKVLAVLKSDWVRSVGESGVGNFITDAQREAAQADIGFMNSSGIRKDISAGPITKLDLFEILPFHNMLMKFKLSGAQIRAIITHYITANSRIQTSGIKCDWFRKNDGSIEFKTILINGIPLDEKRIYSGAASDYLIGESEKYLGIPITDYTPTNLSVFSAVETRLIKAKEIQADTEPRIKQSN